MIGNFKEAFLNHQESDPTKKMQAKNNVPKSVIKQLNKDLPAGFHYVFEKSEGHLVVKPTKAAEKDAKYTIKIDYKENGIPEGLSEQKALDYIYRTQKVVKPSEVYTEINGKKVDLPKANEDPVTHVGKIVEDSLVIVPQPFPPAFPVELSTQDENGKTTAVTVNVRRQPFEDMNRMRFANEDFPALKFQWIVNEKRVVNGEVVGEITIHANPKKAEAIDDAIKAMKIFKGFADGKLCIDGSQIKTIKKIEYNEESFESELSFLETLKQLEEIIGTKFDPAADYSKSDAKLLYELDKTLIKHKMLREVSPFLQFHLSDMSVSGGSDSDHLSAVYKKMEGKNNVSITFIQTEPKKLMGASFVLYEAIMMTNMSVSKVEESVVDHGADITLSNDKNCGNPWMLFRQYAVTDEEAKKIISKSS